MSLPSRCTRIASPVSRTDRHALRHAQGPCAGQQDRRRDPDHRHPSVGAGHEPAGTDRYSKTLSGGLSYGTAGTGSTPNLAGALLSGKTGMQLVHVPYKGGGQAMTDLVGGQIPVVYTAVAGAHQL